MKYSRCVFLMCCFFVNPVVSMADEIHQTTPNDTLLHEEFKVYYNEHIGLSKKPFKSSTAKTVPTKNDIHSDNPGCYIACYSKDKKHAVYSVDDSYHLIGQVRVQGKYTNGLCIPKGYENKEFRGAKEIKEKCEISFPQPCAKGSCQIDGHTIHWFQ